MSNISSGLATDSVDVTLVEAVELLQDDLRVLRAHVIEVMDDYRAVCARSAGMAEATDPRPRNSVAGSTVAQLSTVISELAGLLHS
jgi:hypothetical protein